MGTDVLVLRDVDFNTDAGVNGMSGDGLERRVYAQQDANGNVTSVTDGDGVVRERYVYDPYGSVTAMNASWNPYSTYAPSWNINYLFQGQRYDVRTGLYEFRNRIYDPTLGRFLQQDPMMYVDGANLYQMTESNPVNSNDPMGTFTRGGQGNNIGDPNPGSLLDPADPSLPRVLKPNKPKPNSKKPGCPPAPTPPAPTPPKKKQFPTNWVPGKGVPIWGVGSDGTPYWEGPPANGGRGSQLYPLPPGNVEDWPNGRYWTPRKPVPPSYNPGPPKATPKWAKVVGVTGLCIVTGGTVSPIGIGLAPVVLGAEASSETVFFLGIGTAGGGLTGGAAEGGGFLWGD